MMNGCWVLGVGLSSPTPKTQHPAPALNSSFIILHSLLLLNTPSPEVRAGSNSALASGGGWGQTAGLFCGTRPPRGGEDFRRGNPLHRRPPSGEQRSSRFK